MDYRRLDDFDFIEIGMGFSQKTHTYIFWPRVCRAKVEYSSRGASLRVLSHFNICFHRFVANDTRLRCTNLLESISR